MRRPSSDHRRRQKARPPAPEPTRPDVPAATPQPVPEDVLTLIEERFRNALIADMVASLLGARAEQAIYEAQVLANEYLERIRRLARDMAQEDLRRGAWATYEGLLVGFLDVLEPPRLISRRRGRPPQTPGPEVSAALRRYDEIMLRLFHLTTMIPASRGDDSEKALNGLIAEYAPDLSVAERGRLKTMSKYWFAAELAVRGTRIKPKTLIHRYAPAQKSGRLHTIANRLGIWSRQGSRQEALRFREVIGPDGSQQVDTEPFE